MYYKLIILMAIISLGCKKHKVGAELDQNFDLTFDQTANIENGSSGLKLSFTDLIDSRCPENAQCIWEGRLEFVLNENGNAEFTLPKYNETNPSEIISMQHQTADYIYTLVRYDAPEYPSIHKNKYTITLKVQKI